MRLSILSILVLLGVAGCGSGPDHPRGVFDLSDDPGPSPGPVRSDGLPSASHRGGNVGGLPGAGVNTGSGIGGAGTSGF